MILPSKTWEARLIKATIQAFFFQYTVDSKVSADSEILSVKSQQLDEAVLEDRTSFCVKIHVNSIVMKSVETLLDKWFEGIISVSTICDCDHETVTTTDSSAPINPTIFWQLLWQIQLWHRVPSISLPFFYVVKQRNIHFFTLVYVSIKQKLPKNFSFDSHLKVRYLFMLYFWGYVVQ